MDRLSTWLPLAVAAFASVAALGCSPKIGDDCSSSTDCSVSGDRLCDTTQPGGYCTVFNCEPDTCPDEAQCIAFDTELDPACNDDRWARFERTFCMRRCDNDGDCRGGYVCYDMASGINPWSASVVDQSPEGTKVCISPASGNLPGGNLTEVCSPYDGGFPDAGSAPPIDATPDAPGDVMSDAPDDVMSDAPGDVMSDAPGDVMSDAPGDVMSDAPGDVMSDAPGDVMSDAPGDGG